MKRTFFIVVLAIFFTFDIFFAISSAVAENLKSSPSVEIMHSGKSTKIMSNKQTEMFQTIGDKNGLN